MEPSKEVMNKAIQAAVTAFDIRKLKPGRVTVHFNMAKSRFDLKQDSRVINWAMCYTVALAMAAQINTRNGV